jgi:hypothetical protein
MPRPLKLALPALLAVALVPAARAQTAAPPDPPPPPAGEPQPAPPTTPAPPPAGEPPTAPPRQPPRRPPRPRRRPVYSLLAPAAAAPGQTVIVRGRGFPRRRTASVLINGREVAKGITNSIGNFATGFIVQREWPRGAVPIVSRAGGRQVIGTLRIVSRRVTPYTAVHASSGASMTMSRYGGPPGTWVRIAARGLPGREPVSVSVRGRRVTGGRAGLNGRFFAAVRVPRLEVGRRDLRVSTKRLELKSFLDILASPASRLAAGRFSLVAAGDIACQPGQPRGFRTCRYADTARIVARLNPRIVAPLGDFQYFTGSLATAAGAFDGTWGLFKDRMRPTLGDHEYQQPGARGYFTYFGAVTAPPNGWYSYNLGAWHVVVLNTECPRYVSCAAGSPQERWLRADLTVHRRACTLAYFSEPRFSSAGRFVTPRLAAIWQALYDHGVDVTLGADAHVYERFAPQDPSGNHAPGRGIRQFIVGTGGKDLGRFVRIARNSEVRLRTFGVLALRLSSGSYGWQFVDAGGRRRDSGGSGCH